jgi:hypothetical protein
MLAINATRAVSTWGLDKFMGWFADTPDDPSTLTTYLKWLWRMVYQEDVVSTGWIKIGRPASRRNAGTVMGGSASGASGSSSYHRGTWEHSEWLHLVGRQLGGRSVEDNFVAGAAHANTEMIPIENAARAAANNCDVWYKVTAFIDAGSTVANRINVRVNLGRLDRINYNIDAQRGAFSKEEFEILEWFANTALGNT